MRDIEWFDENGDVMRPEDWHYGDGRLLCLRRASRLDEARVEVSLLLTNNTSESHSFQLPDPRFRWSLRLNSAELQSADQEIELASYRRGGAQRAAADRDRAGNAGREPDGDVGAASSGLPPAPAPREPVTASAAEVTAHQ